MSVPPLVWRGTEGQVRQDDARSCISASAHAAACDVGGAFPPSLRNPPLPYSTPCYLPMPEASVFLCREEEERGVRKRITLENKAKARTPRGGTQGGTREERGRLRVGVHAESRPHRPNNPRACGARPVTSLRLASVRCSIRSLRAEPALSGPRRAFLSDIEPLARSVARSAFAPRLFGAHNRASFGCDNAAACQSVRSVRPVTDGGDGGPGGKKRSVRGYGPLEAHNFFGIDEAGRCTNP